MRQPANPNRIVVADRGRWRFKARLTRRLRLRAGYVRNWLVAVARLHGDLIDHGRNVFRQVIKQNTLHARGCIARMKHRFPLHEPSRRYFQLRVCGQLHMLPLAPVAIGVVHIAAARIEFDIAHATQAAAPPLRKSMRVEHIAFVRAFCFRTRAQLKDFPQIAARSIQTAAGCNGKCRDLRSARLYKIGEIIHAVDGENVAAIAGSRQQPPALIKPQSVDQIFSRAPQMFGSAIRRNAVNFRATGGASARGRKRSGGSWRAGAASGSNADSSHRQRRARLCRRSNIDAQACG